MKKNFILFVFVAMLINSLCAQDDNIGNYVPIAPEAASLHKFTEIPVSYQTGIPNISIPIYEIKAGSLSVPISLSYHAGGIRVEEIASWVGIGWALNAGGVVSRVVRDEADDYRYTEDGIERIGLAHMYVTPKPLLVVPFYFWDDEYNCNQDFYDRLIEYGDVMPTRVDGTPDLFYYNFPGNSGKFVMNTSYTKALPLKKNDLDIKGISSPPKRWYTEWIITGTDGTVYKFSEMEQTCTQAGFEDCICGDDQYQPITTSWYLSEISSADGANKVKFTYEGKNTQYELMKSSTFIAECIDERECMISGSWHFEPSGPKYHGVVGKRLTSIQWFKTEDNTDIILGQIDFIKDQTERIDLSGDYALKEIVIKDPNLNIIKKYVLSHFYSADRLFLRSVAEMNSEGFLQKEPYMFEYEHIDLEDYSHNQKSMVYSLPNTISRNQDYWGYSNGINNDEEAKSLLPTFYQIELGRWIEGADRTPHFEYAVSGTLNKISYPTGGSTEFEYELNQINKDTYLVPKLMKEISIPIFSSTGGIDEVFNIDAICSDLVGPDGAFVYIEVAFHETSTCSEGTCGEILITTEDNDGNDLNNTVMLSCFYDSNNSCVEGTWDSPHIMNYREWFDSGLYRIKVNALDGTHISVNIKYKVEDYPDQLMDVGGLRIKKMITTPIVGEQIVKHYKYLNEDGTSSGNIPHRVSFDEYPNYVYKGYQETSMPEVYHAKLVKQETPNYPLNGSFDKHIGYGTVSVYNGDINSYNSGENGLTKYDFYNCSNITYLWFNSYPVPDPEHPERSLECFLEREGTAEYPFAPYNGSVWKDGLLLRKKEFNKYRQEVHSIRNYYNHYICDTVPGFKVGVRFLSILDGTITPCSSRFKMCPFFISTGYSNLDKTVETIYSTGAPGDPSKATTKIANYKYNDNYTNIPSHEINTISNGKQIVNQTIYPKDFEVGDLDGDGDEDANIQWIENLCENNIIAPVEQVTYQTDDVDDNTDPIFVPSANESDVLSGSVNEYTGTGQLLKSWVLENKEPITGYNFATDNLTNWAMDGNYPVDPNVTNTYNEIGNIIKVQKKDDNPISLLWSYNNTLPVAKAVNADHNEIAHTSFEDESDLESFAFVGAIMHTSAKTGNNYLQMSGTASVQTTNALPAGIYTLEYWAKDAVAISGGTLLSSQNSQADANGWIYYSHEIEISSPTSLQFDGSTDIDEIRLCPSDAQMTTYTYDPLIGMTSQTDANGRTSYYMYDDFGRLDKILDHNNNILKQYDYHYICTHVNTQNQDAFVVNFSFDDDCLPGDGYSFEVEYGDGSQGTISSTSFAHQYPSSIAQDKSYGFAIQVYKNGVFIKTITGSVTPVALI